MNNTIETWITITDFPKYQVSNKGLIRHVNTMRILKGTTCNGYIIVPLSNDICKKFIRAHRLVAQQFVENPDNKKFVCHIDKNRANNNLENLRWVNHQQNSMYMRCSQTHSSIYKGVGRYDKDKWVAHIVINNKKIHIGSFYDEKMAARAYNLKAIELFGEFANLNIISDD